MLDKIVDIAGVSGFILALWLAFYGWVSKRERYAVSVLDYADFGPSMATNRLPGHSKNHNKLLPPRSTLLCGAVFMSSVHRCFEIKHLALYPGKIDAG